MAVLDAHTMAQSWIAAGGPLRYTVPWISVSRAESSWNTHAVSPTDARGLYQLEPYSWPAGAGSLDNWTDPVANSRAAVLLSGGGVNFAPWDTAYANIERTGRYRFLAFPEIESAAANNMPVVTAMLGSSYYGNGSPGNEPGITGTLPAALNWYTLTTDAVIPGMIARARKQRMIAQAMYRN
jgi:hypothetical protein